MSLTTQPITFTWQCDHAQQAEARECNGLTCCEVCSKPLVRTTNPPPKAPSK